MKDKLSLLIADDEPLVRGKVKMMLGRVFRLTEAETAQSARIEAEKDYDAILLDIVFPDGTGIEVCREIKERDPHATVVISSSLESIDAWDEAFSAGADGYLEKRELLSLAPRKIELMIRNLVERNRLRRQAERTSRRQAELLSVLSHDVRAPFQALLGTIERLRHSPIPPDARDNVENLHACAREQLSFINSLLELLRLESGEIALRLFPADVNLPVSQSLQTLGVLAEAKEISVSTDFDADLPEIEADIGKIAQLMGNLLSNAIKFTPRGGSVTVRTRPASVRAVPGVEISVEDSGTGIAGDDREKLFQRFRSGEARGTEGERGTGLGLSICRQIVRLHSGSIDLMDGEEGGTTAKVWLPVRSGPDPETRKEHAKSPSGVAGFAAGQAACPG
jgi:signal transduction histidine kinase